MVQVDAMWTVWSAELAALLNEPAERRRYGILSMIVARADKGEPNGTGCPRKLRCSCQNSAPWSMHALDGCLGRWRQAALYGEARHLPEDRRLKLALSSLAVIKVLGRERLEGYVAGALAAMAEWDAADILRCGRCRVGRDWAFTLDACELTSALENHDWHHLLWKTKRLPLRGSSTRLVSTQDNGEFAEGRMRSLRLLFAETCPR